MTENRFSNAPLDVLRNGDGHHSGSSGAAAPEHRHETGGADRHAADRAADGHRAGGIPAADSNAAGCFTPAPDGAGLAGSPGLASSPGVAERDAGGKFARGNRGGPGNPFAREVNHLRRVAVSEMTDLDMRGLVRAMIELGKKGDRVAARLAFQYTLGKPAEATDPDREDIEEWKLFEETKDWTEQAPALASQPNGSLPLTIVRTMQGEVTRERARSLTGLLRMEPNKATGLVDAAAAHKPGWLEREVGMAEKHRLQTAARKKARHGKKKRR